MNKGKYVIYMDYPGDGPEPVQSVEDAAQARQIARILCYEMGNPDVGWSVDDEDAEEEIANYAYLPACVINTENKNEAINYALMVLRRLGINFELTGKDGEPVPSKRETLEADEVTRWILENMKGDEEDED